jgi:hypothetical protein
MYYKQCWQNVRIFLNCNNLPEGFEPCALFMYIQKVVHGIGYLSMFGNLRRFEKKDRDSLHKQGANLRSIDCQDVFVGGKLRYQTIDICG